MIEPRDTITEQQVRERARQNSEALARRELIAEQEEQERRKRQQLAALDSKLHESEAAAVSHLTRLAPLYIQRRAAAEALAQSVIAWWSVERQIRQGQRQALAPVEAAFRAGGFDQLALPQLIGELRQRAGLPRNPAALDVAFPGDEAGRLAKTVLAALADDVLQPGLIVAGAGLITV